MATNLWQVTVVLDTPVAPDWTPTAGVMDPFPATTDEQTAWSQWLSTAMASGSTDGVQYSNTIGTFIRKFADEDTANSYINYVNTYMLPAHNLTSDKANITKEQLS